MPTRPRPKTSGPSFEPAPELLAWVRETLLDEHAALYNPDHEHLLEARIGFLWARVPNSKGMQRVVGQAELPQFQGGKWRKSRQEMQVFDWFGEMPDFIITLDADFAAECDDVTFCALVDHELYHCGHMHDEWGAPRFHRDGSPWYGMRGHDVEEFVGIVERYGAGAAAGKTAQLVEAASKAPTVARIDIARGCANCQLKAA